MKVRAYEGQDRGELERLTRAMFPNETNECDVLLARMPATAVFVVVRDDGRLGGYVEAGTLFLAVEAWARAHGHRELASDSLIANEVSIAAHKSLGFTEIERQVCFAKRL